MNSELSVQELRKQGCQAINSISKAELIHLRNLHPSIQSDFLLVYVPFLIVCMLDPEVSVLSERKTAYNKFKSLLADPIAFKNECLKFKAQVISQKNFELMEEFIESFFMDKQSAGKKIADILPPFHCLYIWVMKSMEIRSKCSQQD